MTILWDHIFSKFVHAKKRKKISDNKKVLINITMTQIVKGVTEFAPSSNPGCVRKSWISDAMSIFENMGIATQKRRDSFVIIYGKHNKPTTDWIIERIEHLGYDTARARHRRTSRGDTRMDDFT